jgi:hypothetical protein
MYINDRRIRRNRMVKRRRGVLSGLGGAADCGSGQVWCAEYVYNGLPPGQCTTADQCNAYKAANPQQAGTNWADDIASSLSSISKIFGAQQQPVMPVVDTGPSTTTIIAIGAAGLLGVYLLTRK